MQDLKAQTLIKNLTGVLDCTQRKLALLTGLDPHTLSNNQDHLLKDLTPRTRGRLVNLWNIILKIGPLRADRMIATLERHTFKDHKGRMDSVVSAIQQDKYDLEMLIFIAEKAKKEIEKEWVSSYPAIAELDSSVRA